MKQTLSKLSQIHGQHELCFFFVFPVSSMGLNIWRDIAIPQIYCPVSALSRDQFALFCSQRVSGVWPNNLGGHVPIKLTPNKQWVSSAPQALHIQTYPLVCSHTHQRLAGTLVKGFVWDTCWMSYATQPGSGLLVLLDTFPLQPMHVVRSILRPSVSWITWVHCCEVTAEHATRI